MDGPTNARQHREENQPESESLAGLVCRLLGLDRFACMLACRLMFLYARLLCCGLVALLVYSQSKPGERGAFWRTESKEIRKFLQLLCSGGRMPSRISAESHCGPGRSCSTNAASIVKNYGCSFPSHVFSRENKNQNNDILQSISFTHTCF